MLSFSDEGQGKQFRYHLLSYSNNPPFSTSPKFPIIFSMSHSRKAMLHLYPPLSEVFFCIQILFCSMWRKKSIENKPYRQNQLSIFFAVFITQFLLIQKCYQKCFYSAEILKSKKSYYWTNANNQNKKVKMHFGWTVWKPHLQVFEILEILYQWKL